MAAMMVMPQFSPNGTIAGGNYRLPGPLLPRGRPPARRIPRPIGRIRQLLQHRVNREFSEECSEPGASIGCVAGLWIGIRVGPWLAKDLAGQCGLGNSGTACAGFGCPKRTHTPTYHLNLAAVALHCACTSPDGQSTCPGEPGTMRGCGRDINVGMQALTVAVQNATGHPGTKRHGSAASVECRTRVVSYQDAQLHSETAHGQSLHGVAAATSDRAWAMP